MGLFGKIFYLTFGLCVLGGYLYVIRSGLDPFEVSSDQRAIPTGAVATHGGGYVRTRTPVFFYGGFGGK